MVFFYTLPPKAHARGFRVYMGRDKFENEQLLAHGWENDVWFHVDNLSSAHVYLRLPEGDNACTWEEIPPIVMKYCCQLVKNNSIEGCKKKECFVIYTPFANLHKDVNTMQTGAVSFHDEALRIRVRVEKDRELAKKIEKTKEDQGDLDFAALKAEHDQVVLRKLKKERKAAAKAAKAVKEQRKAQAYESSYDRLFEGGGAGASKDSDESEEEWIDEDNFM
jgi:predicted ribosome quality control (RQC) complex YloA/Tae2 family protein